MERRHETTRWAVALAIALTCAPALADDGLEASDTDSDGVIDAEDNCPETPNASQGDGDQDGTGDMCDDDVFVVFCGDEVVDAWISEQTWSAVGTIVKYGS